jgi:hypothetical protein
MATRSVIKVEGFTTAQLYKHWDGYPDSTLPWLEKFNREFTEKRGDDKSYKFAQLIRSSVFMQEEFGLDSSTETGWGVVGYDADCGEEFVYTLHNDGTVTYKSVD